MSTVQQDITLSSEAAEAVPARSLAGCSGAERSPFSPVFRWPVLTGRPEMRIRILIAVLWILGIGTLHTPLAFIAAGGALAVMLLVFDIPLRHMPRRSLCVVPFLLVSFSTLLFSDGWPITPEASAFAARVAARLILCVLAAHLVHTEDVREFLAAFQAFRFPWLLTGTLFLTQRYVHLFARQLAATRDALTSRLFRPRTGLGTLRVYGQIVGGLAIKSIDRSEQVRRAMESRGFHGPIRTGRAAPIRLTDLLVALVAMVVLASILAMDFHFVSA